MNNKKISVIGLGYVGLPLAVEFGRKNTVIGYDINQKRIDQLKKGFDKTLEISKEELKQALNLCFTNDLKDIEDSQIYIITVPTPINNDNTLI